MERDRKVKLLSIIALVLAIAGMSLGFAAFSSTLTISSSATVTPNSDDFSVEFIGMDSNEEYTLKNSIIGISENGAIGSTATITNGNTATISNINVSFTEPGQSVTYPYIIKNTGLYNTYMRTGLVKVPSGQTSPIVCTAADNSTVTQELLDSACAGIDVQFHFSKDSALFNMGIREIYKKGGDRPTEFSWVSDPFIMQPGEYITAYYSVQYAEDAVRADGAFNVEIADSELAFSTAPPSN